MEKSTDRPPLQIDRIQVLWVDDENPPFSLGQYSNEPGPGAIDRAALGEQKEHEYRYFVPAEALSPEVNMQAYRRYESYCRGEWALEGCVARALVSYPLEDGNRRLELFSSGGISGVASDAPAAFKYSIEIEQLEQLKEHVKVFGVPWSDDAETLLGETRFRLAAEQAHEEAQRPTG